MNEQEKNQYNQLMNFIKWKMRHRPEEFEECKKEIKTYSLNELTRWAIRMDIIDS
jgi:hypothetical protein